MIPDFSVLWVVFFVLVLAVVLNTLLFQPVLQVMRAREGAIVSANELAKSAADKARAAAAEFDARTHAARTEVYREMDEKRRAALDRRADVLAATRREAESSLVDAKGRLTEDTAAARADLTAVRGPARRGDCRARARAESLVIATSRAFWSGHREPRDFVNEFTHRGAGG